MHRRQEIREQAYNLLQQALANTPVTLCKDTSNQADELMTVALYTPTERLQETLQVNPPKQRVVVELVVNAIVAIRKGPEEAANQLDTICQLIENALDGTLGGIAERCELQNTAIDRLTLARHDVWAAALVYSVTWVVTTTPPNPANLAELTTIAVNWDMAEPSLPGGGPDEQIDTQSMVTFP